MNAVKRGEGDLWCSLWEDNHERAECFEFEGRANATQHYIDGAILGAVALTKIERARAAPSSRAPNCLLRGTKVQTTAGHRKVEDLAVGDLLPTMFGGVRPIQWIGRFKSRKSDPSRAWPKQALPVRIRRSAIAPDVPHADLFVSSWHALLIDGLLIPAGNLINGQQSPAMRHTRTAR